MKARKSKKQKVDTQNVSRVFAELADELLLFVAETTDETTKELYDEIVTRTPVDTGRAKEGWEIKRDKQGDTYIINDVPYIIYLEEGSSKQAPHGMVRSSIAKVIK